MARCDGHLSASRPVAGPGGGRIARIAAGKLLATSETQAAAFTQLPPGPAEVAVSAIPPQTGRNALALREAELLRSTPPLRRKYDVTMRYVREIGRVIASPLGQIRY